jgi:hypothetical protein
MPSFSFICSGLVSPSFFSACGVSTAFALALAGVASGALGAALELLWGAGLAASGC